MFVLNGRFNADRYRVELAPDPSFDQTMKFNEATVDRTGIAPIVRVPYEGPDMPDDTYYWRAFAGNGDNDWSPPAGYRILHIASDDRDRIEPQPGLEHPYLLIRPREVEPLLSKINRSQELQASWQYLMNAANSMLEATSPDESYAAGGSGQHGSYSAAAEWYHRHMTIMAFVGLVTGESVYTDKAIEMLLAACDYDRWLGPAFDKPEHFDPPWHAALETAMMTTAVGTAYDLLYPHLDEQQRQNVADRLIVLGVKPLVDEWADPLGASRIPRHQAPSGNWMAVCVSSAGVGAAAVVRERPEAREWLQHCRDRIRAWLADRGDDYFVGHLKAANLDRPLPIAGPTKPNFGIDGGHNESTGYMYYAMRYVCFFADALRRTTRENLFNQFPPGILEHVAWMTLAWPEHKGVQTRVINFGDCWPGSRFPLLYSSMMRQLDDGLARWLYERTVPLPRDPRTMVWYDDSVLEESPARAVPMAVFRTIGQVVLREGWSPETPVAAIKFHQNRGHHDLGQFYLFGGGAPTITDSGTAPYGSDIYKTYSSQSIGHNVVLVNNRSQRRTDGELVSAVATSQLAAASGQLAAAYPDELRSWTRDLIKLPDDLVLVFDRLLGKGRNQYDLVLHPANPFKLEDGHVLHVGNPVRASLRVFCDSDMTASMEEGYAATEPVRYVRFNSDEASRGRAFLTMCRWPGKRTRVTSTAQVKELARGRWRIDHITTDAHCIVVTGREARSRQDGDARLLAVWKEKGGLQRFHGLILGGNRLVLSGEEWLRSTEPVNAAIEFGSPLRAHFWNDEPAEVSIRVDASAAQTFVNGERVYPVLGPGVIRLELPAGESSVLVAATPRVADRLEPLVVDDLLAIEPHLDAPAYRPGIIARTSSCGKEGLQALDEDVTTAWMTLPGASGPHWLEVELPQPEQIDAIEIHAGRPCTGQVEVWNEKRSAWDARCAFETTLAEPIAACPLERAVSCKRFRLFFDRKANEGSVVIHRVRWSGADESEEIDLPLADPFAEELRR